MKSKAFIIWIFSVLLLASCDEKIDPALSPASPAYVVDAFVNNKPDTQVIHLMYSQSYFDETLPPGISGAVVSVHDNDGNMFTFTENPKIKGDYIWVPSSKVFGINGNTYTLDITVNAETFTATNRMGRVPQIDSIIFQSENEPFENKDFYRAQFYARDPVGPGDTYWIRASKNGVLLNKPSEINLAYDAAFSRGSNFDGLTFIQPIRNGINPDETNDDGPAKSPFSAGDSVYVEINSLSDATFDYLTQVVTETNRPGGFSELFAKPLANVSTNFANTNPKGTKVLGFFNVAAVSGLGKKFVK